MAYSHNGCQRCKKVRVKCDESIPRCKLCAKKGVKCVYDLSINVYDPSQKQKKIKKKPKLNVIDAAAAEPSKQVATEIIGELNFVNSAHPMSNDSGSSSAWDHSEYADWVPDEQLFSLSSLTPTNLIRNTDLIEKGFLIDTTTMEINDRRILSAILPDSRSLAPSTNSSNDRLSVYSLSPPNILPSPIPDRPSLYPTLTVNWCKKDFFALAKEFDPLHQGMEIDEWDPRLQKFIWDYFRQSKCLANYIFVVDDSKNYLYTSLQKLAPKNAIIGYVVNAVVGNAWEVQSGDSRWGPIKSRNMNIAIKILARQISEANDFTAMSSLLLCILLLYSERSASTTNLWRLHLKGALGILTRCDSAYKSLVGKSDLDEELVAAVDLYVFSKNWFNHAECIAWLSSPNGGCITDLSVTVDLFNDPYLEVNSSHFSMGKFNSITCYSHSLIPIFKRVVETLMSLKLNHGINLGGLLALSGDQFKNPDLKNTLFKIGQLLIHNMSKLDNENLHITDSIYPFFTSSMYAANNCYKNALHAYILVVFCNMSPYDQAVQRLISQVATNLTIEQFPYGGSIGVGIHWSVYFSALISPPGDMRETFLHFLSMIVERGMHVAKNSIDRLELSWGFLDGGDKFVEFEYDCIAN